MRADFFPKFIFEICSEVLDQSLTTLPVMKFFLLLCAIGCGIVGAEDPSKGPKVTDKVSIAKDIF